MEQRQIRNVKYDFTGQVVVVTGAARGQGRSHALAFAEAGADVVVTDICEQIDSVEYELGTAEGLTKVAVEIEKLGVRCMARSCDVRHEAQVSALVRATVSKFGRIDVLINNAGIDGIAHITELSVEAWDDMIDTHVRGAFLMSKAVAPTMISQNKGKIITTGSICSYLAIPSRSHYVTAKHALVGLTKALAIDLAPHRINVNIVCPGAVRSPMNVISAKHPEVQSWMGSLVGSWNILESDPDLQLLGTEEISNAMLWLASDASDYVTGASLMVDAGASIK
jgi:NAD(P)-dependent dehydrogenase (short-subunit alcohol dehydrogenase family)